MPIHTPNDRPLNPNVAWLLELLQMPDMLENLTESQVRRILRAKGLEQPENPGAVTAGGGRLAGMPDAPASVILVTRDSPAKLMSLHLGVHRYYTLDLWYKDANHPTPEEFHKARVLVTSPLVASVGSKARALIEKLKNYCRGTQGEPAIQLQEYVRQASAHLLAQSAGDDSGKGTPHSVPARRL